MVTEKSSGRLSLCKYGSSEISLFVLAALCILPNVRSIFNHSRSYPLMMGDKMVSVIVVVGAG